MREATKVAVLVAALALGGCGGSPEYNSAQDLVDLIAAETPYCRGGHVGHGESFAHCGNRDGEPPHHLLQISVLTGENWPREKIEAAHADAASRDWVWIKGRNWQIMGTPDEAVRAVHEAVGGELFDSGA